MGGTPRGAKISNIYNEWLIGKRHFLISLQNVKNIGNTQKNKKQIIHEIF